MLSFDIEVLSWFLFFCCSLIGFQMFNSEYGIGIVGKISGCLSEAQEMANC